MYFEDIVKRRATHRQLPYYKMRTGQPLLGAHVFYDGLRRFLSVRLEVKRYQRRRYLYTWNELRLKEVRAGVQQTNET